MNGLPTSATAPAEVYYPDSDGQPMAETEAHLLAMLTLIALLRQHFRGRPDVYVIGDMFWYYEEGNPLARKAPDVMVVKGVDPSPPKGRRSFKSWEEKANPCFILELTSESTAAEDTETKMALYQRLGVREYFLFDPLSEYLERPLVGYRLIQGRYERLVPAADGSLPSNELGLRLAPAGTDVVLIDMRTGRPLLDPLASATQLEELRREFETLRNEYLAMERARDARIREVTDQLTRTIDALTARTNALQELADTLQALADAEKRRADEEHRQNEELRRKLAALEAEAAHLRSQLPSSSPPPVQDDSPPPTGQP